jgi:NAD(P)-dependent dehydrogenase (short-subunit alcohol dehydrogenase family)
VSERAALEELVQTTIDRYGRVDVLVNNAGASPGKPIDELDDAEIRRIYDVNLLGPTRLISLVVPHMKRQGGGTIVNIGSVAGEVATSNIYAASKFGVRGLNDAARRELRHDNIKVVLVSPGFVRTAMTYGNKLPMPGPEVIARAVARGIERPRRKIVAPWPYIPIIFVSKLFPAAADLVLGSRRFQRSYRKRKQLAAAQAQTKEQ